MQALQLRRHCILEFFRNKVISSLPVVSINTPPFESTVFKTIHAVNKLVTISLSGSFPSFTGTDIRCCSDDHSILDYKIYRAPGTAVRADGWNLIKHNR